MKFLNISKSALIFALVTSIISEQALSMDLPVPSASDQPIAQVNAVAVAPVQAVPANTTSNLTDWAIALGASSLLMACAIANDTTGLSYPPSVQAMYLAETVAIAAIMKKWTPIAQVTRAGMYLPVRLGKWALGMK
ncbi:hypothetical protein JST56_01980 [Candidatus Dependentiae bacterium]|jgi:hypothetical protein|nr:hypothetical protein [Candidatus Dependentiae bacterium]